MAKKTDNNLLVPLTLVGKLYDHMIKVVKHSDDKPQKNILLFVGKIFPHMVRAIRQHEQTTNNTYRIALIYDKHSQPHPDTVKTIPDIDIVLPSDFSNSAAMHDALAPYQDELLAITTRGEDHIPDLHSLIPYVPFLLTPTQESLLWSTDKIAMRERLRIHAPSITPRFKIVDALSKKTVENIKKELTFPLIVKPSGLAASRLVGICYHEEELYAFLKKVFKEIDTTYQETKGNWTPRVLVEEFIEGQQFSTDVYVSQKGQMYFCPLVSVQTGKSIGFDDFFGYQQMTPSLLNPKSIQDAELVAGEAVRALGLRSVTAHVELLKTEQGWKVIELAPRIGGFRHMLYEGAYEFNHTMNDILIRMGKKPILSKKAKGYTAAMKFFAKKEGTLTSLSGIKKIKDLASFKKIYIHKKPGDACKFAKHGGSSVFNVMLFNKERSELLADIRRIEQTVDIQVT